MIVYTNENKSDNDNDQKESLYLTALFLNILPRHSNLIADLNGSIFLVNMLSDV